MLALSGQKLKGTALFLFTLLILCLNNTLTKQLIGTGLSSYLVTFFRVAVGVPFLLGYLLFNQPGKLLTPRWGFHIGGGLLFAIAMLLWNYGLARTSVAVATTFGFTNPIFVLILSPLFFPATTISKRVWLASFFAFTGLAILHGPLTLAGLPTASLPLLGSIIIFSLVDLLHKKYSQLDPIVVVMLYATLASSLTLFPLAYFSWQFLTYWQAVQLGVLAVGGNLAFYTLVKAYSYASPAQLAPLRYTEYLFALVVDYLVFHTTPNWKAWGGLICIIPVTFLAIHREKVKEG